MIKPGQSLGANVYKSLTTLLSHTLFASPPQDAEAIQHEIASQVPETDLTVARTPVDSRRLIPTADVLVTASLSVDLLDRADTLQWVQAVSSGVDAYPLERLREAGIVLTNGAGIHGEPIAEQILGYLLMFERRLHTARDQQSRRTWQRYQVGELHGKTLGVIGVGAVGTRLAEVLEPFSMDVIGVRRQHKRVPSGFDDVVSSDELFDVLPRVDYLVLACPLTDETRGMIGHEELGIMDSSAVLINIARGSVVDQDALVGQLQSRGLRGAALDVFKDEPLPPDSTLWQLPNVLVTPHMAGSSPREAPRIAELFAENFAAFSRDDADGMPSRVL